MLIYRYIVVTPVFMSMLVVGINHFHIICFRCYKSDFIFLSHKNINLM